MKDLIRKALEEKGMTQKELADKLYVTPQAVSKWLSGESNPSQDNVVEIFKILGIDLTKEIANRNHSRKGNMRNCEIKEIYTIEKAKKEAYLILDELGFASKYSHPVYMLCTWLLTAIIGLNYHKLINNKEEDVDYQNIYFSLEDYMDKLLDYPNSGRFNNALERDFYYMGADLFESHGDYKLPNHDYGDNAIGYWYRFDRAVIKDKASPIYNDLLVAISEILESNY